MTPIQTAIDYRYSDSTVPKLLGQAGFKSCLGNHYPYVFGSWQDNERPQFSKHSLDFLRA